MGKGLLRLALLVSFVVGVNVGCGSTDVDDESSGSAQSTTSTTSMDGAGVAVDCDELATLQVAAHQDLLDLMEGYTLDELEDGSDELVASETLSRGEALGERFEALDRRERELECAATPERAFALAVCPDVAEFRASGEAAEDWHNQLLVLCSAPEPRDLDVVPADVWAEQACDALNPFWLTIDEALEIMIPPIDGPRESVDERQLIEDWLGEFAEVAEHTVVDLTAAGAPDVDEGSTMATAQIIALEEIAALASVGHAALPDDDEGDADYAAAAQAVSGAGSRLAVFDARWGELFDELMAECDVDATFAPRGGPDGP